MEGSTMCKQRQRLRNGQAMRNEARREFRLGQVVWLAFPEGAQEAVISDIDNRYGIVRVIDKGRLRKAWVSPVIVYGSRRSARQAVLRHRASHPRWEHFCFLEGKR